MKKIRSHTKYRKLQRRKARRTLRAKQRLSSSRWTRASASAGKAQVYREVGFRTIPGPGTFSFVNNPERFMRFLGKVKAALYGGRSITIDLSNITHHTNDGLIAMRSAIEDRRTPAGSKVYVEMPHDRALYDRLTMCGISENFLGFENPPKTAKGSFRVKNNNKANMDEANELIQFATRLMYGKKRQLRDVQRIMSECIDNTTFHADPGHPLAENWWATTYYDDKADVAFFSILDNGVGILESLKIKIGPQIINALKYSSPADLLHNVFLGKVDSRTGLKYRGKGLPGIYTARNRLQFQRLVVITNNVFIDFDKKIYRTLTESFGGTFFYWEVHRQP